MSTPLPMLEAMSAVPLRLAQQPRLRLLAATLLTVGGCVLLAVAADHGQRLFIALQGAAPWAVLPLVPALFVLLVWASLRYAPAALGGGVAQVLAARPEAGDESRAQRLTARTAVAKGLLTAAALSGGASLGREGPGIQIGAAVFRDLAAPAQGMSPRQLRRLLAYGSVAGVAATFGTPLAALLFVVEALRFRLTPPELLGAAGIAICAAVLAQGLLPTIGVLGAMTIPSAAGWAVWSGALLCGLAGGLLGGAFARALPAALRRWRVPLRRYPLRMAAALGLLLVLVAALGGGGIHGAGLIQVQYWLEGSDVAAPGFAVLKAFATGISALAAVPGGLVSPTLAVGAGLGVDLARCVDGLPLVVAIALGMAAYPAAVMRAPLASAVLVVELLGAYTLALPLLLAATVAAAVSARLCRRRLFEALADELLLPVAGSLKQDERREAHA